MKVILVVFDGLGDRPIKELKNKTPLESAKTLNMDSLAEQGITGIMHSVGVGIRPGSDTSHLSIFGYDPKKCYTGRGPFEAAGIGMKLKQGDIALRANFGTVENRIVKDRRAGRIDGTEELCRALNNMEIEGVKFIVNKGTGHRAGLVLRGKGISGNVSDQDPHEEGKSLKEVKPLNNSSEAKKTARILNAFSEKAMEILGSHPFNKKRESKGLLPGNCLLFRGAGKNPNLESFEKKYGLKAACIAGGGLYKGVAGLLGMDVINVQGATGKGDTDLNAKVNAVLKALENNDFIFLHIKATDMFSEDGDFSGKMKFIEKADIALKPLTELDDALIVITGDHSTPSKLKMHSADPVPLVMRGPDVRTDGVKEFGERTCSEGGLGRFFGKWLMPEIINIMAKSKLFGN